jgi:hypothetical protein
MAKMLFMGSAKQTEACLLKQVAALIVRKGFANHTFEFAK